MANYKIELGVHVKTSEIREQISKYNTNSNNAKLKLGIKLDTSNLKEQINKLSLGSTGKGIAIPINTQSLDASLREIKSIIADIKASMGTLDNGNMKSLLSSVNQIANALGKAENESDNLVKSLNALSKKDFNINLGIDMNKKSLNTIGYGRTARKQVIPELESQIKELENLFGGQQSVMNKLASHGKNVGFDIFTDFADFNSDSAIKKMEAMEKYINSLKKLATFENVKLDGFNEIHKDASELINDITGVSNAVDKAGDVPNKLKNIFGGGIDADALSGILNPIIEDVKQINLFVNELSKNNSIGNLATSFNRVADALEPLVTSLEIAKKLLGEIGSVDDSIGQSGNGVMNIENDLKEVKNVAETTSDAIKQTFNEAKKLDDISIDISSGNVDDLKTALKNIKVDDTSIENATKELNEMNIVAKSVSGTLKNNNLARWEIKGVQTTADGLERIVTITRTLGEEGWQTSTKYSQSLDKIAIAAEKIQDKLNGKTTGFNGFEKEVEEIYADIKKLDGSSNELEKALREFDAAFKAVNYANETNDLKRLVEANEEYEIALEKVSNQLKLAQQAQKDAISAQNLDLRKQAASLDIDNYLKNNTNAARKFGEELRRLQIEIEACDDGKAFSNLEKEISKVKKAASATLKDTQSFGDKIKKQWRQYSSYFSVAQIFTYVEQGLRDMFQQVVAIDTAMTELKKVTDETDATYNKFLSDAASKAKEIGTTIDGLVSSTADFARLGYGFEDSQGLAEVANIYAVVGDEIDSVETATQSLISTLTAFKDEAGDLSESDFALSIVDKMNEVSNNFAISSGGIGEALQRSASSMMAANNSLDETIALITAA